jgi:hypothetical protein
MLTSAVYYRVFRVSSSLVPHIGIATLLDYRTHYGIALGCSRDSRHHLGIFQHDSKSYRPTMIVHPIPNPVPI